MGVVPYHVGIRVWDDVGREILGLHLLAKGCELHCGIDHSNWKVLTRDRKTPRTQRDTYCLEKMMPGPPSSGGATSLFLGRALGLVGWVGWAGLERDREAADVMG